MGTQLVAVPEFGVLDELADQAWWEFLHGDRDEVLRRCDHGIALAAAIGDEATVRYLLFTRGCALEEQGRAAEAVACADLLLARSLDDRRPYWQAKAIAVRALAARRSADQHDVIDLLAEAWVLVGEVDGRAYNQVSAAVVVANALRKVELYAKSDAQLVAMRRFTPASMRQNLVVDSIQTLAEWAVRLMILDLGDEARAVFGALASRACLLRRLTAASDEHADLVRAAELFAQAGLDGRAGDLRELEGMARGEHGLVGRIGWLMVTAAHAHALIAAGELDRAGDVLDALRREAAVHDGQVWIAAADELMLVAATARFGRHPALDVASAMYHRAARQLWRERQGRFDAVRRRERIHELTEQSARAAELITTDALTGVGNRRAIDDRLAVARATTGALFIDVDDFKAVNELTSHVAGDDVLARIAAILTSHVRAGDLVARFGGDEFVVIVDAGVRQPWLELRLERLAVRVLEAVRSEDWSRIAAGLNVTVSVGLAAVDDPRELLKALSASVGRVKRSGRDSTDLPGVAWVRA